MALFDLAALPQLEALTEEARLIRMALQSIAASLMMLTEIPAAPPLPDKPLGPEAVANYAKALMDMEGEEPEELRRRLRDAGMSDPQIEAQVVSWFTESHKGEEETG